jgi:hypothetical protein
VIGHGVDVGCTEIFWRVCDVVPLGIIRIAAKNNTAPTDKKTMDNTLSTDGGIPYDSFVGKTGSLLALP